MSNEKESIWKPSNNEVTFFTSEAEFLMSSEISQPCKDSYTTYIRTTDGHTLPKEQARNGKYYTKTTWVYIDNESGYKYDATWSEQYKWGVRRTPAPKQKPEDKAQTVTTQASASTNTGTNVEPPKTEAPSFKGNTPKSESSLGIIAEEISNIRKLLEVLVEYQTGQKGLTRASDIK